MNVNDVILWDTTHNRFKVINVTQVLPISLDAARHIYLGVVENKDGLSEYGQVILTLSNPVGRAVTDENYLFSFLTGYWHSLTDVLETLDVIRVGTGLSYTFGRFETALTAYLNKEVKVYGNIHIQGEVGVDHYAWTSPFVRYIKRAESDVLKLSGVVAIDACYMPVTVTLPRFSPDIEPLDGGPLLECIRTTTWNMSVRENHPFGFILRAAGAKL